LVLLGFYLEIMIALGSVADGIARIEFVVEAG
jgi:hypothetical protein